MFTGPNIVTDGLVVHLDAANVKSSLNGTSYWNNLVNTAEKFTVYGTPSYTVLNGVVCFEFNTVGDYFRIDNLTSLTNSTERTLEVYLYPAAAEIIAGDRGTVLLMTGGSQNYVSWNKANSKLSNYWYGKNNNGYHEPGPVNIREQWHYWSSTWTGSQLNQFIDGRTYTVSNITGTSSQNTGMIVGRESSNRQFAGGIALVRVYNRALTPEEVLQNYNATKARFGL